jgi:hypothetical protein
MSPLRSAVTAPDLRAIRVTQLRVARSEWTKLSSLRSTYYAAVTTTVLLIGFGVGDCARIASRWSEENVAERGLERADFNGLTSSLIGVKIAVLGIAVLGVLTITGEYSTGMSRATFAAVPRRLPVLWAKLGTSLLLALAISVSATLVAFFAGQAVLSEHGLQASFFHGSTARVVLGAALYMTLAGLFALGLGAVLRNTAAAISAFILIMYALPKVVEGLPSEWSSTIFPYLPSSAGEAIMETGHSHVTLSPWVGLLVFAGYAAAAIALAALLLVRRDV